jgi:hypothetical protein
MRRIALLFEPGRTGEAALELARCLIEREQVTLTVVSVVPQAQPGVRCGASPRAYNDAVLDAARRELGQARELLREVAEQVEFLLLLEGIDPPFAEFVEGRFDLILLPARRRLMRSPGHPAAAALTRLPGAEVRIVDPPVAAAA